MLKNHYSIQNYMYSHQTCVTGHLYQAATWLQVIFNMSLGWLLLTGLAVHQTFDQTQWLSTNGTVATPQI